MENNQPFAWTAGKSNIFIREMNFEQPGYLHDGHHHEHDHTAIVFNHTLRAEAEFEDGTKHEEDFTGPAHFLIDANVKHRLRSTQPTHAEAITAVEAMTPDQMRAELIKIRCAPMKAWCVYGHRDPQGVSVQRNSGWSRAYAEKSRG